MKLINLVKRNIKYKLFLIYLIVYSIPIVFFGYFSYVMSSSSVERDFINYRETITNQIVKNIDENLKSLNTQSMSIYANLDDILTSIDIKNSVMTPDLITVQTRVKNYLESILQGNGRLYGVTIISMDGNIKFHKSKNVSALNLKNLEGEEWFRNAIATKEFSFVMEPHYNTFTIETGKQKKQFISLVRPIMNLQTGQTAGVLLLDQDLDQFSGVLSNVKLEKNETILVVGKTGNIILSTEEKDIYDRITVQDLINHTSNTSFRYGINGQDTLICISSSQEYGWKVISLIPTEALREKSDFLKNINITLLIVLAILTFIISFFITYFVTTPLKKLDRALKVFEKGDFSVNVPVKGEDELAHIGSSFNAMVANMKSLIEHKYEANILRKQAELDFLQSQINPHFLFNTLNSIKTVIDQNNYDKSSIMVQSLSDIFRYSLKKGNNEVTIKDELEHVHKYLYIQDCRFAGRYDTISDIDPEVLEYSILKFTLQPIVENALYHGLLPATGKGELHIAAKSVNEMLLIYISNTGIGIPPVELEEINNSLLVNPEANKGITPQKLGIYNVNARIKLRYGDSYGLKITSTPNGYTTVKITLPILK